MRTHTHFIPPAIRGRNSNTVVEYVDSDHGNGPIEVGCLARLIRVFGTPDASPKQLETFEDELRRYGKEARDLFENRFREPEVTLAPMGQLIEEFLDHGDLTNLRIAKLNQGNLAELKKYVTGKVVEITRNGNVTFTRSTDHGVIQFAPPQGYKVKEGEDIVIRHEKAGTVSEVIRVPDQLKATIRFSTFASLFSRG